MYDDQGGILGFLIGMFQQELFLMIFCVVFLFVFIMSFYETAYLIFLNRKRLVRKYKNRYRELIKEKVTLKEGDKKLKKLEKKLKKAKNVKKIRLRCFLFFAENVFWLIVISATLSFVLSFIIYFFIK